MEYTAETNEIRAQEKKAALLYDRKMELHGLSQALTCVDEVLTVMDGDVTESINSTTSDNNTDDTDSNSDQCIISTATAVPLTCATPYHVFLCSQLMNKNK